ncbi:MAG: 4Fe-4S dicluster domain-containing protein [Thermodesulfobacterium sp.]|nr:4Fe-4S dicluster domain-containing protein [Thermodesulfobacterium sp.]
MMSYSIIHLVEKCKGCGKCVLACRKTHEGVANCRVSKIGNQFAYFACLHCKKPQCAIACPVGAIRRIGDVVTLSLEECIGCQNCVEACPWGVPRFNPKTGAINKCDLCHLRVAKGDMPYCVAACPEQALELKVASTKGKE